MGVKRYDLSEAQWVRIAPMLAGKATDRQRWARHGRKIRFDNTKVAAIRTQDWKFVTRVHTRGWHLNLGRFNYPLLFDVKRDPGENYSVASLHPDVTADLRTRHKAARDKYEPMVDLFPSWERPSLADWHPD